MKNFLAGVMWALLFVMLLAAKDRHELDVIEIRCKTQITIGDTKRGEIVINQNSINWYAPGHRLHTSIMLVNGHGVNTTTHLPNEFDLKGDPPARLKPTPRVKERGFEE